MTDKTLAEEIAGWPEMPKPPVRRKRNSEMTDDQFFDQVQIVPESGCWLWERGHEWKGYVKISARTNGNCRRIPAHRFAYERFVGPIPQGLELDHLCRVRCCVNPKHLEPVTQYVNLMRGHGTSARNKRKTHCNNGHPFDEQNTYWMKRNGRSWKRCRICQSATNKIVKARQKARRALLSALKEEGL